MDGFLGNGLKSLRFPVAVRPMASRNRIWQRCEPMSISQTEFARPWLDQFKQTDRELAGRLADAVMLVSHDSLNRSLRALLDQLDADRKDADVGRPIAIYAERAVETRNFKTEWGGNDIDVLPMFPGTETGRAAGAGVPPITINPKDQEVGSEGAVANFITTYQRLQGKRVLNHPGPDDLRKHRPSHIVILTDFIGSGTRVDNMLEAFWKVASIKSWHSYKKIKLAVVAYSATAGGLQTVTSHRSNPAVHVAHSCPDIYSAFTGKGLRAIQNLCDTYPGNLRYPYGYHSGGALIAFAHGMPNNAPPVLHSSAKGWKPLFVNRSTLAADQHFPGTDVETLAERAREKLKIRAAKAFLEDPAKRRWIETMLVLTALGDGARSAVNASARTHLALSDVEQILVFTEVAHWTTKGFVLTPLGRRELNRSKLRRSRHIVLPTEEQPYYYPTQLRAR